MSSDGSGAGTDPRSGLTIVITGASSGVGAATARLLSSEGHTVVPVGRDSARINATLASLSGPVGTPVIADLSALAGMRAAAAVLRSTYPRIDVLINNAGAVYARREETTDGHERTIALNVLAPFVLTRLLEPSLRAAPSARVVNLSSAAHHGAHLRWEDLESKGAYRGFSVYSRSKLAVLLVTRAFARRSDPSKLAYFAVHPGFVRTRFGLHNGGAFALGLRVAMAIGGISPERAARTVGFAATAPELSGRSGDYIAREHPVTSSQESYIDADGERLWGILSGWGGLAP